EIVWLDHSGKYDSSSITKCQVASASRRKMEKRDQTAEQQAGQQPQLPSYTDAVKPAYPSVQYAPVATGDSGQPPFTGGGGYAHSLCPEGRDAVAIIEGGGVSAAVLRLGPASLIPPCDVASSPGESVKKWVHTNLLFYYISFGLFIVVYLVIMCCKSVRRRFPCNMICLSIFTLAFSYMTGYRFHHVLRRLILVISLVFILFALACSISYAVVGASRLLDCVYGGVGALVFSIFLVYDTQQVVGGRKYELSPEEYVSGAMQLYLDVVYIFIYLLPLGSSN
uniref:LFG1 protein n=1 Tax=Macrostomum lignano TaxID=282301 RepID=A0A1I8FNY9_9PLAT